MKPIGPSGRLISRSATIVVGRVLGVLGDRLEVGAGAEGEVVAAGEDEHPGLVVGLEAAVALEQLVGGVGRRRRCGAQAA